MFQADRESCLWSERERLCCIILVSSKHSLPSSPGLGYFLKETQIWQVARPRHPAPHLRLPDELCFLPSLALEGVAFLVPQGAEPVVG